MSWYILEKDSLKEMADRNQLFFIDLCISVRLIQTGKLSFLNNSCKEQTCESEQSVWSN